jgi:hypothetical protein
VKVNLEGTLPEIEASIGIDFTDALRPRSLSVARRFVESCIAEEALEMPNARASARVVR